MATSRSIRIQVKRTNSYAPDRNNDLFQNHLQPKYSIPSNLVRSKKRRRRSKKTANEASTVNEQNQHFESFSTQKTNRQELVPSTRRVSRTNEFDQFPRSFTERNTKTKQKNRRNLKRCSPVTFLLLGLLLAFFLAGIGAMTSVLLTQSRSTTTSSTTTASTTSTTTPTTTTTTTTSTTTTTTTTTSRTTTTTTTAPPSSICVSSTSVALYNNEFIYSPSQLYVAGVMNNQFGVYRAYSNANVTSSAIWTASQSSTSSPTLLSIQNDRNLVVYRASNYAVLWQTATWQSGSTGTPFCLRILDTGNLIWTNNANTIIWQTNSAQPG